jgi:hypothetical protein
MSIEKKSFNRKILSHDASNPLFRYDIEIGVNGDYHKISYEGDGSVSRILTELSRKIGHETKLGEVGLERTLQGWKLKAQVMINGHSYKGIGEAPTTAEAATNAFVAAFNEMYN